MPLRGAGDFARETTNMAAQYRDGLTRGDIRTADEIPVDSGATIHRGLTKAAVYREATGELHECPVVCPHLGGMVRWNHAKDTWDCPCHGSHAARKHPSVRRAMSGSPVDLPRAQPDAIPVAFRDGEREIHRWRTAGTEDKYAP